MNLDGARSALLQCILPAQARLWIWRILGCRPRPGLDSTDILRGLGDYALEALGTQDGSDPGLETALVDLHELSWLDPGHAAEDLDALRLALTPEFQREHQDRTVDSMAMEVLESLLPAIVREIRGASGFESARPRLHLLYRVADVAWGLAGTQGGPAIGPALNDAYLDLEYGLDRGGCEAVYADVLAGGGDWGRIR